MKQTKYKTTKELLALTKREITTIILASVAFIIIMGFSLYEAGLVTTLSILGISLGMTGLAMYFYFKQSKEVETIKVGDIVYFNELESEVLEAMMKLW